MIRERKNRIIFGGCVGISFVAILIYNFLTPLMSDDLLFDKSIYRSFFDIIRQEYHQYLTWNGRSVLQIILKIFSITPKWLFNIFNSVAYVVTMLLIYKSIRGRKYYDYGLYVLINVLFWFLAVDFSQTVLWLGGACNYLWGVMIILGYIVLYRSFMDREEVKSGIGIGLLLFFYGIVAGWGNENTSGGAILIILLFTLHYYYKKHRVEKWMLSGISGLFLGFIMLLLAPGNKIRGELMKAEESYQGIAALISRGLKIFKAIDEHLLIYLLIICFLGTYFYYKKYKIEEFIEVAIFTLSGLATAGVLIFTAEPMARAYFGANIYVMIAAVQMIQLIRQEDILFITLRTGGTIGLTLILFFTYIEQGANLARILREVRERENYIIQETEKGHYNLTLPKLRPQFETRFSFMYDNDISLEEEFWINKVYCIRYGLESIKVVEREDYTEY